MPDDPIATIALLVAVLSLIVSVRSCAVSEKAAAESHIQFQQDRQLVLKGKFTDPHPFGCSGVQALPITDGFQFQGGSAFLASKIYPQPIEVSPDGNFVFAGDPCSALSKFSARLMRPKPGFESVGQGDIPIIIRSFYAVKGDSYTDVSLYLLHTTIGVQSDQDSQPIIIFSGLSFVRRMPANEPVDIQLLDKLLASKDGFTLSPKTP